MSKHHNKPPNSDSIDLKSYFDKPVSAKQKQYETIRAVIVDKLSAEQAAIKFGYTVNTVYSLIKEARAGKLDLFIKSKKGPAQRRTSLEIQQKIIAYRKESLSSKDIHKKLAEEQDQVSVKTIERILKENGFGKLKRRTHKELGLTRKNKIIAQHAENLDFNKLEPFSVDCPVSGVFFFIPYIIESGILDVVKKCKFPESGAIGSVQACLSMLLLKLIGHERLSHMDSYDHEPGLAIFASLNRLPSALSSLI